tara:strand:+ start:4261 stop:5070 length:810 start_codon:yes stop_codon:yes gene_type:complete
MQQTLAIAALLALTATGAMAAPRETQVASLDYCADQYLLKLLPRSRILALSPDAPKHFSYMREHAANLPTVRPRAEDILGIGPDLVLRSYGGGPRASAFLQRAGIEVVQIPYAGSFADIRRATLAIANELGVPDRGAALVAEFDARLATIQKQAAEKPTRKALYMTPTGVTSGPGTLVHEMLLTAGLENFEENPGWRSIPLEQLAYRQPDLVVAAFFDIDTIRPELWSPMRHPVAKRQLQDRPTVMLQGAWTACGAWFLLDAVEALAAR